MTNADAIRQMTIKDVMKAIEDECNNRNNCVGCRFAIPCDGEHICFQGTMWEILSEFAEEENAKG